MSSLNNGERGVAAEQSGRIDFGHLNQRALQGLPSVLEDLLELDVESVGKESQMLNPLRSDYEHGSFSINGENGPRPEFADGESGGDATSLVTCVEEISQIIDENLRDTVVARGQQ